ncbi:MAG: bile acid:sodium symporter family protein [Pirellulales bacterium]|nr:bile acid:sodium symporter family protein [Pirellulales bacterium]
MGPSPSLFDRMLEGLREAIARFLLVWLVLGSLLALRWTAWLPGVADPFAASQPALSGLIAATMFAIGSLLPRDEVAQVLRRWPAVLGGTAVQYASMPLLAYLAGRGLGLEGPLLTGVIMAGCVPGAMASNVLSLAARANVSYSVSLTTSSTLFSPILVPLGLKLTLGQWRPLPAGEISFTLLWTVVAPVIAGYALARRSRRWEALARRTGSIVANLTILWIIAVVVALNRERLDGVDPIVLAALAMLNIGGYAVGGLGAWLMRLPQGMRRALALEVGMQNAGLGTMLVLTAFPDEPEAAIPTALYTFGCMATGTLLAQYWARRGGPDAPASKSAS